MNSEALNVNKFWRQYQAAVLRQGVPQSIQAADSFVHFFGDWIRDSTRCLSVW